MRGCGKARTETSEEAIGRCAAALAAVASRRVRCAALPLVRRSLREEAPDIRHGLVRAAVLCLQLPETRHHASKALRHLVSGSATGGDGELASMDDAALYVPSMGRWRIGCLVARRRRAAWWYR